MCCCVRIYLMLKAETQPCKWAEQRCEGKYQAILKLQSPSLETVCCLQPVKEIWRCAFDRAVLQEGRASAEMDGL